jgi:hypothetical protein
VTVELGRDARSAVRCAPTRHRWLAGVLAVLLLLAGPAARPAAAQDSPTLASLLISLWPEFDRAGVLVILDGTLPTGTNLPAQVALHMPATAGQPNAVAYTAADGSLLAAAFTTTPAGNDILVTFPTEALNFRLEYYDPALRVSGSQRAYTFNWASDYAVTAAVVRLQQPAGASDLTTTPALTAVGAGAFGLQYFEGDLGALAAGQTVPLSVGYSKPDGTLSSKVVGGAAPAATEAGAGNTAPASYATPIVLAVAGILLAAGGAGFVAWRKRTRATSRLPRRQRRGATADRQTTPQRQPAAERVASVERPAAAKRQPAAGLAPATSFCTQCGQPRLTDDKFCRQCGSPVRAASNN